MTTNPPGRLVDIGGHRLHLYTLGDSTPTVVFDAALGGSCLSWTWVQPEVAKFARACSYDRAGLGWSDPGAPPRTTERIAAELRALLDAANVPAPYVLVGHSFGGFTARYFAARYREQVSGVVLVDVPDPADWTHASETQRRRLELGARLSRRGATAARLGLARLIYRLVRGGAWTAARAGVSAVSGGALRTEESRLLAPLGKLPPELRPVASSIWTEPKFYEALAAQMEALPESAAQVASCGDLGDLPLVVISASQPAPERVASQEAMARLSTRGRHVIASNSGHWIPLDQPDVVVEAIREVVEVASATIVVDLDMGWRNRP